MAHAEARRLESIGAPIGAPVLAINVRERLLRVRAGPAPAAVAALFFLERRGGEPGTTRFEPVE